jgi:nicotinate-nucleotide pyrophosphorylase (carboxylating)
MLDNFEAKTGAVVAKKIRAVNPKVRIEVSGGITRQTIVDFARFADRISVGALTHSVSNIDFSLELVEHP